MVLVEQIKKPQLKRKARNGGQKMTQFIEESLLS